MKPVSMVSGLAAPMPRADIDTDTIIPQRWLITTEREGLGRGLFSNWRYLPDGVTPDPDFVLNRPHFAGATILVAGPNYGCGSSREHAVWAHLDFGVAAVVSSSFGPIFRDNALKNGLLLAQIDKSFADSLLEEVSSGGRAMTVDLVTCTVTAPNGGKGQFAIDPERRAALLEGVDDIERTLSYSNDIRTFQARDRLLRPWL